jgi:hypothetical protein
MIIGLGDIDFRMPNAEVVPVIGTTIPSPGGLLRAYDASVK